jgi:peptidoglycan/xylan/chitin deacetylase (PgdA/CDA1 family)
MRPVLLLLALFAMLVAIPGNQAGMLAARGEPAGKRIAISFDDAPRGPGAFFTEDDRAARLIAALKDAGASQTVFFVNPGRINIGDGDEARLARYVVAGHVIANHTFTHPKLSRDSAGDYLADIDKASAWLNGRPGYRPWFRFPALDEGGTDTAKRDAVRAGLAARGLRNGYVTVDGLDWNMEAQAIAAARAGKPIDQAALRDLYVETHVQSADFSDALARRTLGRSPVHMLLLHETDLAALYIGNLIAALRADGWEVVTADQAYADPVYAQAPDTRFAGGGTLIEQLAWEKGLTGSRWYDRDDIHVANRLFAERVLHEAAR